jgi:hypothetical protein
VVGAVEAARNGLGRQILGSVLLRADEPAEALGYHFAVHGKRLPAAVKRGIADAATKLYTERAAVKYAARGAGVQPGDVIDLTHPRPAAPRRERCSATCSTCATAAVTPASRAST